jgi:predicted MPP superfamily phosphohydrolase
MPYSIEFSPILDEARACLKDSKSVLLHAPRYFGKRKILERLSRDHTAEDGVVVEISTEVAMPATQPDLQGLWNSTARALGAEPGDVVETIFDFETSFQEAAKKFERPHLVLIGGEGRWNEENHFLVVSAFNRILQSVGLNGRSMLSVVATDDYSMFHSRKKPFESALAFFEKVHCPPLTVGNIINAVGAAARDDGVALTAEFAHELATWIEQAGGGHPGIVDVLLKDLSEKKWTTGPSHNSTADARVRRSHLILGLRQMIKEDPTRYARTALKYREPLPRGPIDPRVDFLIQLGVLQWHHTYDTLKLCPGTISAMMQEVFENSTKVARIANQTAAVFDNFDSPVKAPGDDDLVIVHISDLHISRNSHRFRLLWKNNWETVDLNSGTQPLVQLLYEDLESLDLIGLVDALVISGDFVERGTDEEFENAETVVRQLLERLNIPEKRLSLIPGNHDVLWPDEDNPQREVSRVPYEKFAKKFGRKAVEASLMTVNSRSGKSQLRLLELDSNRVEGPDASGIGFVSDDALSEATRLLKEAKSTKKKSTEVVNRYTWMSVHHHVFPATPLPLDQAKKAKVSVLGNATELLNLANRAKIELVLHGHEHQPSVTVARRWWIDKGYQLSPITTVGAGSFGAATKLLGPILRNHYHIIYRRPHEIVIRSRMLGDSGNLFEGHEDITLDNSFMFGGGN